MGAIGILAGLEQADRSASLFINSLNSPLSDLLWQFFSDKLVWIPLYLTVLVFFFLKLGWKSALKCLVACVLTILICDQFSNLIKDACTRLRPCHDPWMLSHGTAYARRKGQSLRLFLRPRRQCDGLRPVLRILLQEGKRPENDCVHRPHRNLGAARRHKPHIRR